MSAEGTRTEIEMWQNLRYLVGKVNILSDGLDIGDRGFFKNAS